MKSKSRKKRKWLRKGCEKEELTDAKAKLGLVCEARA